MTQTSNPPNLIPELVRKYLRKPDEPDRLFPKNKKVEVVFLIEAVNAILPRTEGADDITIIKLPGTGYEVPMILPEKLQAVARRKMLAQLRDFRDRNLEKMKMYLSQLAEMYMYEKKKEKPTKVIVGFTKAREVKDNPEKWNCYIQPPGGDISDTTDVGMDGFCPACVAFGVAITNDILEFRSEASSKNEFKEAAGLKSRVEFDPAITFLDKEKSTATYTHIKVGEGVSWTGTSLYSEQHVLPGTIFVGKVTLEDVTENELIAFLSILSSLDRIGGRERIYGGIRVYLVGIRGGKYETVSALEIARYLAKEYGASTIVPSVDEIRRKVASFIKEKGFMEIDNAPFLELLENDEVWNQLWKNSVEYDKQVVQRILDLVKGAGKYTKAQEGGPEDD